MQSSSISPQVYLSTDEIEEIHSVFILLDSDGSGILTLEKLQKAIQNITKNSEINRMNLSSLYAQMDIDQNGSVTWPDFLHFISYWLVQFNVTRPKFRTDLPMNLSEKRTLHRGIAGIIANGYVNVQFNDNHVDSLEARTETWDYLGEGKVYSIDEKKEYFEKVVGKVQIGVFLRVLEEIRHSNIEVVKAGLEELKEMFGVLCYFSTAYDRQGISEYLMSLFQQVLTSGVLNVILPLLAYEDYNEIQWQVLSIVTMIAPGPRLPNYPNESKNCKEISKSILIQSGALLRILQLCSSKCIEVRGQALLAIGFITRYDSEIRDILYMNGAIQVLLVILQKGHNKLIDNSSLIRAAWVLSIFSGATMNPNRILPPNMRQQDLNEIAETIVNLFQSQDESNLLANSLISLSYILPNLVINEFNKWILERLIQLMMHEDFIVKKAVFQTVRNVICQNPDQCRMLTEYGLFAKIGEILVGRENSLKLDACCILRFLTGKGYIWEFLNPNRLSNQLQALIKNDEETRWEVVRVIKFVLDSSVGIAVEELARSGLVDTIFKAMGFFRVTGSYISEIYTDCPVVYQFGYLNDCLLVLEKFIISGWITGDYKITNTLLQYFQLEQANTLIDIIKILIDEVKKGKELHQIAYAEIQTPLLGLIEKFVLAYKNFTDKNSQFIVEMLTKASVYFKNSLGFSADLQLQVDNMTLLNSVQKFVVKTMDSNNYPYGDNHIIQNLRKEEFEFIIIKNTINNLYGTDKKIEYTDSKNDRISIDNQASLIYAMIDSANFAYQEHVKSLQLLRKPVPNTCVIPQVEIKFIVSGVLNPHGYSGFQNNFNDFSYDFVYRKDMLLRELANMNQMPLNDLEFLYVEFSRAVRGRRVDGRLNKTEFFEMMSKKINNFSVIEQLFNAIDELKTGFVEFKGFVAAIGILRSGYIERRWHLVFNAFSKHTYGYLEKSELYDLIVSNDPSKLNQDLKGLVNLIFNVVDNDRDDKLTFSDFKQVLVSNYFTLDPFWTGHTGLTFDENLTPCIQCGKKVQMRGARGLPSRCDECSNFSPSMRAYFA